MLQASVGNPILMYNLHSRRKYGEDIDEIFNCSESSQNCGISRTEELNEDLQILQSEEEKSQSTSDVLSILTQPIYTKDSSIGSHPVGVLLTTISWLNVLNKAISHGLNGIKVVVQSDNKIYNFRIDDGEALFDEMGRQQSSNFDYLRIRDSVLFGSRVQAKNGGGHITIEIYPTNAYFTGKTTYWPYIYSVVYFLMCMVAVALFVLYDHANLKATSDVRNVLEHKRKFVRFISHEVRTPLNTVSLKLFCYDYMIIQLYPVNYTDIRVLIHRLFSI